MAMDGSQKESGVDGVIREAANQKDQHSAPSSQDQAEFDAIARARGQAQDNTAGLLVNHLFERSHHDKKDQGKAEEVKKPQDKAEEVKKPQESGGVSEKLHASSDEARERVYKSNDRTYDAIEEAKKAVQKRLQEQKHEGEHNRFDNEVADSYAAINEAKEMLKDKFEAKQGREEEYPSDSSHEDNDGLMEVNDRLTKTKHGAGEKISSVTQSIKEAIM